MNNNCNCGYNPCRCHTTCATPTQCIVAPVKPSAPTVTVAGLLKLIEAKCDKETCKILAAEINLLYTLLGLIKPVPVLPTLPVTTPPAVPPQLTPVLPPQMTPIAFQLVSNMVASLDGDLKEKYPSAELMKSSLNAIWECLYDKQQHHGDWDTNFIVRDLLNPGDTHCLFDGNPNSIPNTAKTIIPVDVGSTVYHVVDGKRCLFESLVDNNIIEPSKLAVLDGLWINYCDIKDVIDCVLPRRKLINCAQACDDPNGDGVIEDPTLCFRVDEIEHFYGAVIESGLMGEFQTVTSPGDYFLHSVKVLGSQWAIPIDGWYKCTDLLHVKVDVNQPDSISCDCRTVSYIALDNVEVDGVRGEGSFRTSAGKLVDSEWLDGSGSSIFYAEKGQVVSQFIGAKADPAQTKTGINAVKIERKLTGYTIHKIAKTK